MYEEWAGELWGGGTEAARETLVPPSTQPANEGGSEGWCGVAASASQPTRQRVDDLRGGDPPGRIFQDAAGGWPVEAVARAAGPRIGLGSIGAGLAASVACSTVHNFFFIVEDQLYR